MTDPKHNRKVQLTALQMTSTASAAENLEQVAHLLTQLPEARPQLVVLPEAFSCFGAGDKAQLQGAEQLGEGQIQQRLAALAKQHGVWLVAGTMPIVETSTATKFSAACLVFNDQGERVARYNKMHLFDVEVEDATGTYFESKYTAAGTQVVTVKTDFGTVGLAVCYDVRFPELFRALREQGAEILVLPSAFTQVTGAAHWHQLVRARAIEQQCFMVAAGQVGVHQNGRETFGHSMVVDGWGQVLAEQAQAPGVISAAVDLSTLNNIRKRIPVAEHNQFKVQYDGSN